MDIEEAKMLVIQAISTVTGDKEFVESDEQLMGHDFRLPAVKHVEVCQLLEGIADERGFHFDWTFEAALSKSQSMFTSVTRLAEEFSMQSVE